MDFFSQKETNVGKNSESRILCLAKIKALKFCHWNLFASVFVGPGLRVFTSYPLKSLHVFNINF